jgi:hypothetical protein
MKQNKKLPIRNHLKGIRCTKIPDMTKDVSLNQIYDGEINVLAGDSNLCLILICCDCGLTHQWNMKITSPKSVEVKIDKLTKQTEQLRSMKMGKLFGKDSIKWKIVKRKEGVKHGLGRNST